MNGTQLSTVFSPDAGLDIKITVDGVEFGNENIISVSISKNVGGMNVNGISTAMLNCVLVCDDFSASACGVVKIFIDDVQKYGTYYINTRKIKKQGGICTVTLACNDNCYTLEQPFDYSDLVVDSNGDVFVSNVMIKIASQCGFSGIGGNCPLTKIPITAVKNQSCRSLLEIFSVLMCGTWYCTNDKLLQLSALSSGSSAVSLTDKTQRSDVILGCIKGPIGRVIGTGANYVIYDTMGTDDFMKILRISSEYLTQDITNTIAGSVNGATYQGFTIENALCNDDIDIGAIIYTEQNADSNLRASNIRINPTIGGIYVSLSAEDVAEKEFDYTGELQREINNRMKLNTQYNGVSITNDGLYNQGASSVVVQSDGTFKAFSRDGVLNG